MGSTAHPNTAQIRLMEERTAEALRRLYGGVSRHLAAGFAVAQEAERAGERSRLMGAIEMAVPEAIEAQIRRAASGLAWRPAARAAVLALLDAAKEVAEPDGGPVTIDPDAWERACLEAMSRQEFTEDTGLEGREIALAVHHAAAAILAWPDLAANMPMYFRGALLTVTPAAGQVKIERPSEGAALHG